MDFKTTFITLATILFSWPIVQAKPYYYDRSLLDVVDCSSQNPVPSQSDCHSFYQCHNGIAFRQSCGFLLYNPISFHCDWPQRVTMIRPECRKTFAIFPNSNEGAVKWTKGPKVDVVPARRDHGVPRKIHIRPMTSTNLKVPSWSDDNGWTFAGQDVNRATVGPQIAIARESNKIAKNAKGRNQVENANKGGGYQPSEHRATPKEKFAKGGNKALTPTRTSEAANNSGRDQIVPEGVQTQVSSAQEDDTMVVTMEDRKVATIAEEGNEAFSDEADTVSNPMERGKDAALLKDNMEVIAEEVSNAINATTQVNNITKESNMAVASEEKNNALNTATEDNIGMSDKEILVLSQDEEMIENEDKMGLEIMEDTKIAPDIRKESATDSLSRKELTSNERNEVLTADQNGQNDQTLKEDTNEGEAQDDVVLTMPKNDGASKSNTMVADDTANESTGNVEERNMDNTMMSFETNTSPRRYDLPWSVSVFKPVFDSTETDGSGSLIGVDAFPAMARSITENGDLVPSNDTFPEKVKNSSEENGIHNPYDIEYLDYDYDMDEVLVEMDKATTTEALILEDHLFKMMFNAQKEEVVVEKPLKISEEADFPFTRPPSTSTTPQSESSGIYDPFYPFEDLPFPLIPDSNLEIAGLTHENHFSDPIPITPDHVLAEMPDESLKPGKPSTTLSSSVLAGNIFSKLANLGTDSGMTPFLDMFKKEVLKVVNNDQIQSVANEILKNEMFQTLGSNPLLAQASQNGLQLTEEQLKLIMSGALNHMESAQAILSANPALASLSHDIIENLTPEQLAIVADQIHTSMMRTLGDLVQRVLASETISGVTAQVDAVLKAEPMATISHHVHGILQSSPLVQINAILKSPEVRKLHEKAGEVLNSDDVKIIALKIYQVLMSSPVQSITQDLQTTAETHSEHLLNQIGSVLEGQSGHIESLGRRILQTGEHLARGVDDLASFGGQVLHHGGQIASGVAEMGQLAGQALTKGGNILLGGKKCNCQDTDKKQKSEGDLAFEQPQPSSAQPRALDGGDNNVSSTGDATTYYPILYQEGDVEKTEDHSTVYYFPFVPRKTKDSERGVEKPHMMANCLNHFLDCLDKIKANPSQVYPGGQSCQDHFQECSWRLSSKETAPRKK